MQSARRKTVLWLAGLSLIAVVAVAIFDREQIAERWYIYRLGSEDAETVDDAARRLAAMGSTRAIMPLIEQVPREVEKGRIIIGISGAFDIGYVAHTWRRYWTDSAVLKALHDLGAPAKDAVEQESKKTKFEQIGELLQAMQEGRLLDYSKERPVQQQAQTIFLRVVL